MDLQLDNRPPPSPTPAGGRPYPDSFTQLSTPRFPTAGPSSPITFSPQHLRSATYPTPSPLPIQRTPSLTEQFSKYGTLEGSPPGRANQELARFFAEKAEAGDARLTAFEQAGVYQLLQQGTSLSLSHSMHADTTPVSSSRRGFDSHCLHTRLQSRLDSEPLGGYPGNLFV